MRKVFQCLPGCERAYHACFSGRVANYFERIVIKAEPASGSCRPCGWHHLLRDVRLAIWQFQCGGPKNSVAVMSTCLLKAQAHKK